MIAALWNQHSPDLTSPQFAVLQVLDVCGLLDQSTLNARAGVDRSTSTPLLERLIRLGWVQKEPDALNRAARSIDGCGSRTGGAGSRPGAAGEQLLRGAPRR